jgi:hypothetical protein
MRFYASFDPAFAGLNAGAQRLDIAGAGLACRCATATEPDSSSAVNIICPDRIPVILDSL